MCVCVCECVIHVCIHSFGWWCWMYCYCFWFELMNEFKWVPHIFSVYAMRMCIWSSFYRFFCFHLSIFVVTVIVGCRWIFSLSFSRVFISCLFRLFRVVGVFGLSVCGCYFWCSVCLWYHWLSLVFINKHLCSYVCRINKVLIITST